MSKFTEGQKMEMQSSAAAILICNGVTPAMDGFHYILDGVYMWHEYYGELPPAITKEIYPCVGKKHNRSWPAVERAVRVAVERATDTPLKLRRLASCFGFEPEGGKYSNAQFISLLAHYVASLLTAA